MFIPCVEIWILRVAFAGHVRGGVCAFAAFDYVPSPIQHCHQKLAATATLALASSTTATTSTPSTTNHLVTGDAAATTDATETVTAYIDI